MTLDTLQQILNLIIGLTGVLTAAVTTFFAIKNAIKNAKDKTFRQNWNTILAIADAAIKQAEASEKSGADKKKMVIETVKAGCSAAGINADDFLDQLSNYIDQTISFVNDMKKK